ncbi:type II secretion system F family protein [Serratia quinivorans]|uniref:type II secretion system F family protein n=1 Tax=Serratia quinivorans TaxID=137545 RepID=UPI00217A2841|nr:type II secretion system F family protein [Serratia quinivorans]CAI1007345.1 type IV pilin biogenesis protein [Serratia quinivorans]CAI1807947.1 type IV pilin biogenesis protein [Serratia quinivorans]
MSNALLQRLDDRLLRLAFRAATRREFYRSLQLLLGNQVQLNQALIELYAVYSDDGAKPKTPMARIIDHCQQKMNNGLAFSEALGDWLPPDEKMLLQAGESAGDLVAAFSDIEKIMNARKRIVGAVIGALAYPLVLFTLLGFLLRMVANDLVPKFAKIVDPDLWTGAAAVLYQLANFVNGYGLITVVLAVVLVLAIAMSLPYLRGGIRIRLDRLPPWSIYRMIQGATFMLSVSALLNSGMQIKLIMRKLAQPATPWLKERVEAASAELSAGRNLGEALSYSGYHFPDRRANNFLRVIAAYSGVEKAIAVFATDWLEETVVRIQKAASLMLVICIMLVGITLLMVIAGAGGLQEAIQNMVGNK